MAALSKSNDILIRAAAPGEGRAVASLWRELWDAHEAWGGYPGSHDERVLIVRSTMRTSGLGRALLEELAHTAKRMGRGSSVVLAAEVLEPNPAHTFYAKCAYVPVSYNQRIVTSLGAAAPVGGQGMGARIADPRDALPIALLEATLAARRRAAGDLRFDRPRAVDATLVGGIAAHLGRAASGEPSELVAVDSRGDLRGSATLAVALLEPPFLPVKRAILGRFAIDPACDPTACVAALVALGSRLAASRGAPTMELTDLTPPGAVLYEAALATGARPWSRVVEKRIS
jgi:hypothetical protein